LAGGKEEKCVEWLEEDLPPTAMVLFRQAAEAPHEMDAFQGSSSSEASVQDVQQNAACRMFEDGTIS